MFNQKLHNKVAIGNNDKKNLRLVSRGFKRFTTLYVTKNFL